MGNPDAVAQWDHEANGKSLDQCTKSCRYRAHFICDCEVDGVKLQHKYVMYLYNFQAGERCPVKAGKQLSIDNCLATHAPEAVAYWDAANKLKPDKIVYGSGKHCWLKCIKCAMRWKTSPHAITNNDGGISCPQCRPPGCGYSAVAIRWLDSLNIPDMQHAQRGGEYRIDGSNIRVDGYSAETNTVYEFHGTFWHGDPRVYKPDKINAVNKKTFGKLYDDTKAREDYIEDCGYKLVTMWEFDYQNAARVNRDKKDVPELA